MFSGIVEELGSVSSIEDHRLFFRAKRVVEDASVGSSIAVNGVCLTVVELSDDGWAADISDETFARSALGQLSIGSPINFERPVRLEDRLGGHLVQGHVDCTGVVVEPGENMVIRLPREIMRYVVEKGSISVDGVSLTVVNPTEDTFSVALIPHTLAVTTLGSRTVGDMVNIEVDVMAKYAEKLLLPSANR